MNDDIPCGRCEAGIYELVPLQKGVAMFGDCQTQKEALQLAPRCKCDSSHICFGARDFIVSSSFPMSSADKEWIARGCEHPTPDAMASMATANTRSVQ